MLGERLIAAGDPAQLQERLAQARERVGDAQTACAENDLRNTRRRLRRGAKALARFVRRLETLRVRNALPEGFRLELHEVATVLRLHVLTLRDELECPGSAA